MAQQRDRERNAVQLASAQVADELAGLGARSTSSSTRSMSDPGALITLPK